MGGGLGAWDGRWQARRGRRRPAAVLCHCGGIPTRRGGAGRASELHEEARKVLGYSIWAMGERTGGSMASRGSLA